MKWDNKEDEGWRWRYALLPTTAKMFVFPNQSKEVTIWLEWYKVRHHGPFYKEKIFTPPSQMNLQ